jgi:hypothetical protein
VRNRAVVLITLLTEARSNHVSSGALPPVYTRRPSKKTTARASGKTPSVAAFARSLSRRFI